MTTDKEITTKSDWDILMEMKLIKELMEKTENFIKQFKEFHHLLYDIESKIEKTDIKALTIMKLETLLLLKSNIETLKDNLYEVRFSVDDFHEHGLTSKLRSRKK